MMRSLFSGVSGLKNHQTRMDVIGNNISNVNTTGFKSSRVTFADTLNQTMTGASAPTENLGGTNPKQIGLGSAVSSIDLLFTDGSVQSTGKNTDLCLSGNGLFVVSNGSQTYYTRNGAFEFDADGNYVVPGSGMYVQGWMASGGTLSTTGSVGKITIPAGKSMESSETEIITYSNNLNAATTGYTISSILVNKTDGTSETVSSYNPNSYIGNLKLTCSDGGTYVVTPTTSTPVYTAGQNGTISIGSVSSVTANGSGQVELSIGAPGDYYAVNGSTAAATITVPNTSVTSGTYSIGDNYSVTKKISNVQTIGGDNDRILLTFTDNTDGITSVTVPKPSEGNYEVGDNFVVNLKVTGATATTGATVTSDTNSVTIISGDSNATLGSDYSITRQVNEIANESSVESVTITTTDGNTLTGLVSSTYAANGKFYPSVTTTATIYDSLGTSHSVPILFTKTADNTWALTLNGGSSSTTITEPDGTITTVNLSSTDLKFTTSGKYISGSANLTMSYTNGAADKTVTINMAALTQYAGNSTINATSDGNAAGTLESVSIDASGIITGTYTNGVKQSEAQVAVAQFTNASGLTKTGSSLYQESNNSGTANIKTAADLGVKITASALEMSNVDIANEFADMIVTQRGFQSNSKIITVGDEMLETVINMKR
ncbi:MAG: flagellar hook-basal body complex protein [Selenomonas ruminantium]|nr:flagellar hook-basal body complex protein [Selenomonas ruminantium]